LRAATVGCAQPSPFIDTPGRCAGRRLLPPRHYVVEAVIEYAAPPRQHYATPHMPQAITPTEYGRYVIRHGHIITVINSQCLMLSTHVIEIDATSH